MRQDLSLLTALNRVREIDFPIQCSIQEMEAVLGISRRKDFNMGIRDSWDHCKDWRSGL